MPHALDYDLISETPAPIYIGELPRFWEECPARVVVNSCGLYPGGDPVGRVALVLPMLDVLDPTLALSRTDVERFLDAVHVFAKEEATYWHCHAGINRSAYLVAAYLHRHRGHRISDAIDCLRLRRNPMVLCNSLFEGWLRSWYAPPKSRASSPFPSSPT